MKSEVAHVPEVAHEVCVQDGRLHAVYKPQIDSRNWWTGRTHLKCVAALWDNCHFQQACILPKGNAAMVCSLHITRQYAYSKV